mgnify:CR=1 FL=1
MPRVALLSVVVGLCFLARSEEPWEHQLERAQALAEATPDDDCLQKSLILSEEEFYRQRLARVTNLLGAYQAELGNLEQMLAAKTADLRSAVQAQGLPASDHQGPGPSDRADS